MTFLVYFLIPLLCYVFIPRTDSSQDVSRNTVSDKRTLEISTKRSSIKTAGTGFEEETRGQVTEERRQRHTIRHSRYRSERRRHPTEEDGNQATTETEGRPDTYVSEEEIEYLDEIDNEVDQHNKTDASERNGTTTITNIPVSNEEEHNSSLVHEMLENEANFTSYEGPSIVSSATPCPKCGGKEELKRLHIEMFKHTLLSKLGMTSPPNVQGPLPPLPFDFYLGEDFTVSDEPDKKEDDRKAVKTREVFIFGTDVTHRCHNRRGTGCYSFNLTDRGLDPDEIGSVELWIYKQQDLNDHHIQTFMVSELDRSGEKIENEPMLRHRNIVKRIETRLKDGWMKIYVRRTVMRWLSKPHRNNGLAVICKTCQRHNHKTIYGNKEGRMPILVFYIRQNRRQKRRHRRETDCIEGGNNCCRKESLIINFRDIGWDYIMAPTTIRPNYCTGSCNGIQAAYYNHTRVVQTLQQSVMHNYGSDLQPCCSPVSFRQSQSLLYRDHHGTVRKIDIPDLIVGECGCT